MNRAMCQGWHPRNTPPGDSNSVKVPSPAPLFAPVCAVILTMLSVNATATNGVAHPLQDITDTAVHYATDQISSSPNEFEIKSRTLDPRLNLARCGEPLSAHLPRGQKLSGNATISVRCAGPKAWKLFVPIRIVVHGDIAVAARPLVAGTAISAADIHYKRVDLSRMNSGYLTDISAYEGFKLRQNVPLGQALRINALKPPTLVERGQKITISAGDGPFAIRMDGTAMAAGHAGQRIRVKNASSGRIVEGTVVSHEVVKIGLR